VKDDSLRGRVRSAAVPLVKKYMWRGALVPGPALRRIYRVGHDAMTAAREGYELARRSLVSTPLFLAQCAKHGQGIVVDHIPYIVGHTHIEVGDRLRVSGLIGIHGNVRTKPVLKIGDGVYFGHDCGLYVAERIEIGNYVAIGSRTFISDTMGHSHKRPGMPIWEDEAAEGDVAPVVIEEDVHIGRDCMILKGVRIGARCVVGAGSVVRSSMPPDSIVAGNPARVAGWRDGKAPTATAKPGPPPRDGAPT
jgi:acetyltransferase-like isoleucine patch superfamily enzyme